MEFDLWGTRVSASFGFFAVLALYILCDQSGLGMPALAAVALHESGHVLALRLAGARIPSLHFCPFGIKMERRGLLGTGQEAVVYLGGVLANAAALLLWTPWRGWDGFALVNAGLIFFNLLPVGRLDGGQLLRLALGKLPPERAAFFQLLAGFLVLAPLFAAGFSLLRQGNATLLLTACYLAITLSTA